MLCLSENVFCDSWRLFSESRYNVPKTTKIGQKLIKRMFKTSVFRPVFVIFGAAFLVLYQITIIVTSFTIAEEYLTVKIILFGGIKNKYYNRGERMTTRSRSPRVVLQQLDSESYRLIHEHTIGDI